MGHQRISRRMHLARCLAFVTAKFDFHIVATHIKGALSVRADALSRNNLPLFLPLHSKANQEGATVPQSLLDLLILSKPELDIQEQDRAVELYFRNSLAPSTQKNPTIL